MNVRKTLSIMRRAKMATAVGLAVLVMGLVPPTAGLAKEFTLVGSVDCSERGGVYCVVNPIMFVNTDSVSGRMERIPVDVTMIRPQLLEWAWAQDGRICLDVRDGPNGRLQAVGMVDFCWVDGRSNPGLSSSNRVAAEQPRPRGPKEFFKDVRSRTFDVDGVPCFEVRNDPFLGSFVGCGPTNGIPDFPDPSPQAINCENVRIGLEGDTERFKICDLQ